MRGPRAMVTSYSASWSRTVAGTWAVGLVIVLGACLDAPVAGGAPVARVVAGWDPLACGEPHRVVLELALDPAPDPAPDPAIDAARGLAEDAGTTSSASAPCHLGGLSLDVPRLGTYR